MKVLVVEDERSVLTSLLRNLRHAGWEADGAENAAEALEKLGDVGVVVTDLRLPGMDGIELLREIRKRVPNMEVIVMTAFGTIPSAVSAMREGACAYLTKPIDVEELLLHLREVKKTLDLRIAVEKGGRGGLVGSSAAMRRVFAAIDAAAASQAPVLVTGETGTGKDLCAEAIHKLSVRRDGPFVEVNLGAIPRDLVEGELFGHEKGAFTGAHARKNGRFTLAGGGTLFLDDIDAIPLDLQPKILRVIEKKEVWALGSEKNHYVDARIVSATNADIEETVRRGAFREDLYYRLNVLRIEMPPLRDHSEDIPQIARVLLDRIGRSMQDRQIEMTAPVLSYLMSRHWKGNVRELANALERAVSKSAGPGIGQDGSHEPINLSIESFDAHETPVPGSQGPATAVGSDLPYRQGRARVADEWAKSAISSVLLETKGNVSEAARMLKMSRTALIRLISKYNLQ